MEHRFLFCTCDGPSPKSLGPWGFATAGLSKQLAPSLMARFAWTTLRSQTPSDHGGSYKGGKVHTKAERLDLVPEPYSTPHRAGLILWLGYLHPFRSRGRYMGKIHLHWSRKKTPPRYLYWLRAGRYLHCFMAGRNLLSHFAVASKQN